MPVFRIIFALNRDDPPHSACLEAMNEVLLLKAARPVIADELGHPGEIVMFMPEKAQFTIGAGFWSRSGFYQIEIEPDQQTGAGSSPAKR